MTMDGGKLFFSRIFTFIIFAIFFWVEKYCLNSYAGEVVVENPQSVGKEGIGKTEEEDVIFEDDQGKKCSDSECNEPSPRGVLEIALTGTCDSDNINSDGCGSLGDEKQGSVFSHVDSLREQLFDPNAVQWKSLFSSIKRKSARSISIIPLLGGVEMIARKSRKKLLPTSKSEDCGDLLIPKPSWRNFSLEELAEATDNFSPGKIYHSHST